MTAYAVAHLWDVVRGDAIAEYLERIDATLAPFGGRFIVHGGAVELLEGQWPGSLVVIGFPTHEAARSWDTYRNTGPSSRSGSATPAATRSWSTASTPITVRPTCWLRSRPEPAAADAAAPPWRGRRGRTPRSRVPTG